MYQRGLTLLELLIALSILGIVLALGIPGFQQQTDKIRAKTATNNLYSAIHAARTQAIYHNNRTTIRALGTWAQGWEIFTDENHNGKLDPGETRLQQHRLDNDLLRVEGNRPVKRYISFIGTGESRYATGSSGGAFQAGTLTLCSKSGETGYQLVLARMGRVRVQRAQPSDCR